MPKDAHDRRVTGVRHSKPYYQQVTVLRVKAQNEEITRGITTPAKDRELIVTPQLLLWTPYTSQSHKTCSDIKETAFKQQITG